MFCVYESLESTSCEVKQIIECGLAPCNLFAVLAYSQTKGRGRLYKKWQSPKGNLYFTFAFPSCIIQNNQDEATNNNLVSIISALALKDLLSYYITTKNIAIKWSNDIMVENKKIAGILIEKIVSKTGISYFSVGVGVNINTQPLVENPKFSPTCIKNYVSKSINVLEVASIFNSLLLSYFNKFFNNSLESSLLLANYKENLMFLGKNILFKAGNKIYEGTFIDISKQGFILLKENDTGLLKELHSGEILYYET